MTPFHTNVSLRGFHFEDSILTVNLASGIGTADIGKAVTIDTSGPNKFKLAGDGDPVMGRLESVEDRTTEGSLVGAVAFRFANSFKIASGETVQVGDTVVGAGDGEVKAATTKNYADNFVAEVGTGYAVVVKI